MAENTAIEWTDHTWSPWEGCQKVGPGCDHCYAEARNRRFAGGANWGPGAPRRRTADWSKPYQWQRRAAATGVRERTFPSLCDPFDNAVDPEWRSEFFALIAGTPNLDHLLLTKRIGNAAAMIEAAVADVREVFPKVPTWPWPNVWLGATVVNQEEADRDIPKLLATPARVRFLSIEPMLGAIDLTRVQLMDSAFTPSKHSSPEWQAVKRVRLFTDALRGTKLYDGAHLDWIIAGGESGPNARPMHPDWARSLRDQCAGARVAFNFKQWGEWTPDDWGERAGCRDTAGVSPSGDRLLMSDGYVPPFDDAERLRAAGNVRLDGRTLMDRVGKKAAGRLLDGVEHNGFPP